MGLDLVARDEFLTVAGAARACNVTRRTVLRWIHTGRIRFARYPDDAGQYRVPRAEIQKMQELHRAIR